MCVHVHVHVPKLAKCSITKVAGTSTCVYLGALFVTALFMHVALVHVHLTTIYTRGHTIQ
jgi:hypothetical protein